MVEGFKQTDIGLIPNDWTLEPYTEIASLKHGFQFLEEHFSKIGIGVIKIGNLKDGAGLNLSDLTYIPYDNLKRFEKVKLKKGDVLMALTGATLGKVCMVNTDMILLQNYRVGNFIPNEKTTREFIYQICQSEIVQKVVKDLVNSGAQPNLGKKDFDKIFIPLPPTLTEQTAIANALNDADALINQLEQLLTKKRNIKTGAMQELLKPKEGWEMRKLGEIFDITAGGDFKKEFSSEIQDERHPFPIYSNSLQNYGAYGFSSYYTNEADCITVTARGTIGYSCYRSNRFTAIGRLLVLKPKQKLDCFYFSEYINNKIEFVLEVTGVPQLTAPQISKYEVSFPKLKTEQARIAQILSDMDNEIQGLEKQLEKYKMLKQGMMQSLLTGKIRLVLATSAK